MSVNGIQVKGVALPVVTSMIASASPQLSIVASSPAAPVMDAEMDV